MTKQNIVFGLAPVAIVLMLLVAVVISGDASAIDATPAGLDMTKITSTSSMLPIEAWDMF